MKSNIVELMMDTIFKYESKCFNVSRIQISKELYILLKDDMNIIGDCDASKNVTRLCGVIVEPNSKLVGFNMKVFERIEKEIKEN